MLKNLGNILTTNNGFIAICLLCFSLASANLVRAEYKKPPKNGNDAPRAQSTGSGATRGLCNSADNNLKANIDAATLTTIAPYTHVGQSASTNPTMTWYVPDRESYPLEFSLAEFNPNNQHDGKGKQIYQTRLSSSAGIMTHSLPTEASLVPGQIYVWQVVIVCNPNSPSESLMVNNRVKIVEKDPATISQINSTEDPVSKANTYATSGLWYDAIAEATSSNEPQARDVTIKLISQLAAMENNAVEPKNIETHQQNLERIIESLQQK